MCGIAGIVDKNGVKANDLNAISKVLSHRGPDDEGFYIAGNTVNAQHFKGDSTISDLENLFHILSFSHNTSYTLGLLHRRLSIIDVNASGHQPMYYNNGKLVIVFNGEIYNYNEIKNRLLQKGYKFVSLSDTEVILAAYMQWNEKCVDYFVGMWSFAIYDVDKKNIFISRDRFGIKPLYFYHSQSLFCFASEIKAFFTLNEIKPLADLTATLEFIAFGATSCASGNLFKNIKTLPPAHNLTLNVQTLNFKITPYYNLAERVKNYSLPHNSHIQDSFNTLLNQSIDMQLRADVPVGSTLSGGLDSSTVVAIAALKMEKNQFKTFTAAYNEGDIDESGFAKSAVSNLKNVQPYFTYPDIYNYWNDFEKLTWHQDLPVNSTSMYAQWEVMKSAARENIKVLLDGQGADEILGGYYNFAGIYLIEKIKSLQFYSFLKNKKELQTKFSPNINNTLGKAAYYFLPDFIQKKVRSKKRVAMGVILPEYNEQMKKIQVPARGGKSFREQSFLSIEFGLQDLLRYEDRNSMAFSIESRVPFLDHRLVEFSIALNNDLKIYNGWTKHILRKAAQPLLPDEVVWRKYKMGFLTPQKSWKLKINSQLNSFINDSVLPPFIDKEYLLNLNKAELNDTSHLSEFWKLISFVKWAEVFKVKFE